MLRNRNRVLRRVHFRAVLLVGLTLLCTSCGTSSCDGWGNAPRTEYYIAGGAIEFRQPSAAPQPVLDYVRTMMDGLSLYMNLWRVDADDSDEQYKLEFSGPLSNWSSFHYASQLPAEGAVRMDGQRLVQDGLLCFDFSAITVPDERFTALEAWGTCDYDDAQRLIKQVRLPEWSDNVSTDSAEVTWEVAGRFEGAPFSVSFTQVYYGKSRYPVYPMYFGD